MHKWAAISSAILLVSFIVAAVTVPPDPFHWCFIAAAIFLVSVSCYTAGERHGRTRAEAPVDPDTARPRGRCQFGLSTLFGLTTAVALLLAGVSWQSKLERRFASSWQLMRVSDFLEEDLKAVRFRSAGGSRGGDPQKCECHWYWEVWPGAGTPEGLLETLAAKMSERLHHLGAETEVAGLGGVFSEHGEAAPVYSGKKICYSFGDIKGSIVLRLLSWNDGKRANIVLDHTQFR